MHPRKGLEVGCFLEFPKREDQSWRRRERLRCSGGGHPHLSGLKSCQAADYSSQVWEEIGYDVSSHFNPDVMPHEPDSLSCPPPLPPAYYPDDDCIEIMMKEQRIRLYIVSGVSEDTEFQTKTRKEISVSLLETARRILRS